MFNFDFSGHGGSASLRRLRERMEDSRPSTDGLWTYPVVTEKCGCGASTEIVCFDDERAEAHFSKWRETHGCSLRSNPAIS